MYTRAPIPWIVVAGTAFLGYMILMAWCAVRGPADLGVTISSDAHSVVIDDVRSGSSAAAAGLKAGDRLLAPGGAPIRTRFDWMAVTANWDAGGAPAIDVLRGSEQLRVVMQTPAERWRHWSPGTIAAAFALWGARLLALAAAMMILVSGPASVSVLLGAWFLAAASVSSVVLIPGIAAAWRQLPVAAGALLWFPAISPPLLPVLFFAFMARFPQSVLRGWWQWAAALAPGAFIVPYVAMWLFAVIYTPERSTGAAPMWLATVYSAIGCGYVFAGIGIQAFQARRLRSSEDRTRATLLAVGSLVGWAASVPIILFDWYGAAPSVVPVFFDSPAALLAAALFVASIVVLAVILLRRKVFGFRVIIRTGLQYALARKFLLSIVPICALLLSADLLRNADRPLREILNARAWAYASVGALGALAAWRRNRWLEALDRRFFREQYHAQQILRDVAEVLRTTGDPGAAAARVVAQVEQALHSEVVALMVRDSDTDEYRVVAAAPAGRAPPRLAADSRLISLVRLLGKPVELSLSSSWLIEQLPQADVEYARNSRIELIIPVATGDGSSEALLIAGAKRSEQPYSREDQDLMSAIAANLALLLSSPAGIRTPPSGAMCRECPVCGTCYDSTSDACLREGAVLEPKTIPRVLVQRYRLERKIGEGGMGTVYEGLDTALDRRVAVKVIHDRLVGSAEAAGRFRREAQAAGSFSHPNIVTVYDFGIVAGTRAFLVMELLRGRTLREAISRCERFPLPGAMEMIAGISEGIDTAHRRHMIHRDLKPENILLDERNGQITPKILDFGLIKSISPELDGQDTTTVTSTRPGILMGTFRYIAPELFAGDPPGIPSDLWALAVICYEVLTGYLPFEAATGEEWRRAVIAGRFTPVGAVGFGRTTVMDGRGAGGPELDEFFGRALSPDPGKRPVSAREFARMLGRALGEGERARGHGA